MEKAARRLLRRMLGRHHEPLTLPLRLASVGARPVDKLRCSFSAC